MGNKLILRKNIFKLLTILLIGLLFINCKPYKDMTDIPEEYVLNPEWNNEESEIKFKAMQSMENFQNELAKLENERYEDQVDENIEPIPIVVKTKNPFYNPKKWIKTKNPAYNPKKWIKVCAFGRCAKTKNPAYNPKKWIKTKNPAYSPNKFTTIVTSLTTVQGYKIAAWVNGKINLTPFDGNKFNIKVPIKTNGWITLLTQFTPPIVRKPFDGEIILDLDISVDIEKNWCVKLNPNTNFTWQDKLKLDLTYGLKLLQVDLTSLADPQIEKMLSDIEEQISSSFDCSKFKDEAKKQWETKVFQLNETSYAVAQPKEIALSQIQADNDSIRIFGGIKTDIKITSDISNIPDAGKLPNLTIISPSEPSIKLSLPIEIPYELINDELTESFSNIDIGDDNSEFSGKLKVKNIKTFPSGENIGLKVKFETDMNKKIFDVRATAYFTGVLNHRIVDLKKSDNQMLNRNQHFISYTLDKLAFNEFGNGKDKLILTLAYNSIKNSIEKIDDVDISKEVVEVEELLLKALDELVINLPNEAKGNYQSIEIEKPIVKIKDWAYTKKDLIMLMTAKVNRLENP